MKDADIIAIVALIISIIINFFTWLNTAKINKYNSYSNTIISERIKSMEDFKVNSATIITLLSHTLVNSNMEFNTIDKIGYLSKKLIYQLNIRNSKEMKLAITLEKCNLMVQVLYLWQVGNESSNKKLKKLFENNEPILRDNFVVLYNSKGYWDKYINEKFIETVFLQEFTDVIQQLDLQLKNQIKQEWEKSKAEVKVKR